MKKFLLTLIGVVCSLGMWAESTPKVVKWNAADFQSWKKVGANTLTASDGTSVWTVKTYYTLGDTITVNKTGCTYNGTTYTKCTTWNNVQTLENNRYMTIKGLTGTGKLTIIFGGKGTDGSGRTNNTSKGVGYKLYIVNENVTPKDTLATIQSADWTAVTTKSITLEGSKTYNLRGSFKAIAGIEWEVEYPAVNLNDAGFATYSSANPFEVKTEGVKAYIADVDGQAGTITLSEVEGAIPAGQGVLLYGAGKATATVEFQAPAADPTTDFTNNDLKATTTAEKNVEDMPTGETVWALGSDNKFYPFTGNIFRENRAYLIYGSMAAKAMRMIFADNDATAINAVSADKADVIVKGIENGRIVIKKNGVKYNVSGQVIK